MIRPLENTTELFDYLNTMYSVSAQYDSPPDYEVNIVCKGIDKGSEGTDILGRIVSGIVAYKGDKKEKCNSLSEFYSSEVLDGWDWQVSYIYVYLHIVLIFVINKLQFTKSYEN